MPFLSVRTLRRRLPALCLVALLHLATIGFLLHAIPKTTEPAPRETVMRISLLPTQPPAPKKRVRRPAAGANAIYAPFNPDNFRPSMLRPKPHIQGLILALGACAPEKYDMASYEIRAACDRIGMAIKADPGHFGVNSGVTDSNHWQRELLKRNTPLLTPCMSKDANVLYTLVCIYDQIWNGYAPKKMQDYSK